MKANQVFIITGEQGAGKTTKLIQVVEELKKRNYKIAGFVAPGFWKSNLRTGFELIDVFTGKKYILCQNSTKEDFIQIGRFYFNPSAIESGKRILQNAISLSTDFVVIDEIGIFELEGELWASSLYSLFRDTQHKILITVRSKFLEQVIIKFKLTDPIITNLDQSSKEITNLILSENSK